MTEDIPKIFSEDLLLEISKSKTPVKLIIPIIQDTFKYLGPLITEDDSKASSILGSLFLDSYVEFKYKFEFSSYQCSILLNILHSLLVYSAKSSNFDKDQDLEYFQAISSPFFQGLTPIFSKESTADALNHIGLMYFNHHSLYKFIFTEERAQENIVTLLDIDIPLPTPPHSSASQRIQKVVTEAPPVIEVPKEAEVVVPKESLKDKLLKNMDESLREKFLEKISEARETMNKQLDQRDKMLKQKWEDLEKELKRKRRRG
jgi:Flagellar C1a complex subunit C1a-32